MARVSTSLLVLVALAAVVLSATPTAARRHHIRIFSLKDESDVMCVGEVAELLQQHEGRQRRAYDHKGGFRAVGAGYNLDDNKDERRKELEQMGLDYDKVYKGEISLDDLQISGLLVLDAKRALERAERNIEQLRDFCCMLRAVFADIQHTAGSADNFPRDDLDQVIERATSQDWKSAADELEKTKWCSEGRHKGRCSENLDILEHGCQSSGGKNLGDGFCVGQVAELLSQHEGRQRRAYDHKGGFRAVGVGYNLDDNKDERRKELESLGLDYDKIYNGETELNDLQISGLLILDAKRALKRVEEHVEGLKDICCPMRAVFADVIHTARSPDEFQREDFDRVIEKITSEDFETAAQELRKTQWCSEDWIKSRCGHNSRLVREGCPSSHSRSGCF